MTDKKQNDYSEKALNKFNTIRVKSKELKERTEQMIEDHRTMNYERFENKDMGYQRAEE